MQVSLTRVIVKRVTIISDFGDGATTTTRNETHTEARSTILSFFEGQKVRLSSLLLERPAPL